LLLFQVYRSQLERVTESWKDNIGSFEKLNLELKSSLAELRIENDDLKQQVIQNIMFSFYSDGQLRSFIKDNGF